MKKELKAEEAVIAIRDLYAKRDIQIGILKQYTDQELIAFAAWYSGMTVDKVKSAYERYKTELTFKDWQYESRRNIG